MARETTADGELWQRLDSVGRRAFGYAWQMLRHREDALDAVQAAMLSVWRHRHKLDPQRDAQGWFFRVLRNQCLDTLRRRKSRRTTGPPTEPTTGSSANPAIQADQDEDVRRLRAALGELNEAQREIILLRDFHDLSYADIARTLNVPQGTVMSRLHRARTALRDLLETEVSR